MIGLVTDSNAQLPAELRRRYDVTVVPFTIVIDGEAYQEGVDIGAEEFYGRLAAGAAVSTATPSPGEMLAAYERLAAAGAEAVVSVHIGSSVSGAVGAVRIAAASSPVPVEVVDTGTASFAVGCCVWGAGEVLAAGGGVAEAAEAAGRVAATVGNVFVVGAPDLARRGGRLAPGAAEGGGVPVLALEEGSMRRIGAATDVDAAVQLMVEHLDRGAAGRRLRVGVGHALAPKIADALAEATEDLAVVEEVVRYEVGPSVGVHTGPGTVGAVFFPTGGRRTLSV